MSGWDGVATGTAPTSLADVRPLEATVLEVQRMSTEDGPGIRTTVFFKGCPLACAWCQNPESIEAAPQVVDHEGRCIECGACRAACTTGARLGRGECTACGACVEACPTVAREKLGRSWAVDDLAAELLRDQAWYGETGGVTLSGGEPAVWPRFVGALLDRLRARGVHAALDTCGESPGPVLVDLARRCDLVLYDLKTIGRARHEALTGRPNDRILANVRLVGDLVRASGGRRALWVRTPLIPGATADAENIREIGAFLATNLPHVVDRWELCAFNPLCAAKYRRLGRPWAFAETPLMTEGAVAALAAVARGSVGRPEIVVATGPMRPGSAEGGQ